jgi:hypothetical protein
MSERTRDERIEDYCDHGKRQLAEWLVDAEDEAARLRSAWTSARLRAKSTRRAEVFALRWAHRRWSDALRDVHRYRTAWLSARRRAVDEFNHGAEALTLRDAEIARLRAEPRKSTYAASGLECVGVEDDGSSVYRLRPVS